MSHIPIPGRSLKVSASPGIANILNGYPNTPSFLNPPPTSSFLYPTPSLPPPDVQFHAVIGGQLFKLNYDLIMYDQPNIFTRTLLEGYSDPERRPLNIPGRSPALFAVIYEYLSGYAILPNPAIDLRNLLSDCEYYGFQRLKDELTLPKIVDAISSRHQLSRVVRLEDVASPQTEVIHWTEDGLMDANEPSKHLLVFVTKVNFRVDLVVNLNGDCIQNSFAIELPSYAASLSSKPLNLRGESRKNWTAVTAETLSSTPFSLNDNQFEGNFGDLIRWIGSFTSQHSGDANDSGSFRGISELHDPAIVDSLSKAMPDWADNFRLKVHQRHKSLQFSYSFWATELSIIIAPPDGFHTTTSHMDSHPDDKNLVAKIINCSLSTGLHRRKCVKPFVNI